MEGGSDGKLVKFQLYETQSWLYLVGRDQGKTHWRILKIDRTEPSELNIVEDPVIYTRQECAQSLQRVDEGNKSTGGITFVTKAYGIVGFIKFLESFYMILVTKRRQVGTLCGHPIYAIAESQVRTVPYVNVQTEVSTSKAELRYKKLVSSIDLTKDFFFSYTYRLMYTLQRNSMDDNDAIPYDNMFVWNAFLTSAIRDRLGNTRWTVPLIHGYFEQTKLSIYGRVFSLLLIARRSRHFAGTRYLKRGLNDKGKVANDVEAEQIILDESCGSKPRQTSSSVQNRGSIPLFWSQEASRLSPKPDIVQTLNPNPELETLTLGYAVQRHDPFYEATKLHFEDLARRYGNPIIILNLIKKKEKRPREMMLRREFAQAVRCLNQVLPEESRLKFIHWDFHKFAKSKSANVLAVLGGVAGEALDHTGFYYSGNPYKTKRKPRPSSVGSVSGRASTSGSSSSSSNDQDVGGKHLQSGVLRTNCIDCLDRTNVAQFAYGLAALGRQLHAIGFSTETRVEPDSSMAAVLMDMYQNMGDALAFQYGGSAAHNTVFPERQGKWKATTQSQELIKSIRRYYSNTYTDGEKQDAMNLFLGNFQPEEGKRALWDLDSDYYLHVKVCGEEACGTLPLIEERKPRTISKPFSFMDDSSSHKLTSFDKLLEVGAGPLKIVKTKTDTELKNGSTRTAPDAAEVQLKSPNWLFGERKVPEPMVVPILSESKNKQGGDHVDTDWIGTLGIMSSYDRASLLLATSESEQWYGSDIFFGMVDDSPANQHYAQYCEVGNNIDPFDRICSDEEAEGWTFAEDVEEQEQDVELSMQQALNEYEDIGNDLSSECVINPSSAAEYSKWIFS